MNRCLLLDLEAQFVPHLRDAHITAQGRHLDYRAGRQEWPSEAMGLRREERQREEAERRVFVLSLQIFGNHKHLICCG
jgi:hypothetical protein